MNWFFLAAALPQIPLVLYLSRRLTKTKDQLEQTKYEYEVAIKAVKHLQQLNAQIRRQRNAIVLNGDLYSPYTVKQTPGTGAWRIILKQ